MNYFMPRSGPLEAVVDGRDERVTRVARIRIQTVMTRRWRGVHQSEHWVRKAPRRVSIRIAGSRTVAGCIRRRWPHEHGRDAPTTRKVWRVRVARLYPIWNSPRTPWRPVVVISQWSEPQGVTVTENQVQTQVRHAEEAS